MFKGGGVIFGPKPRSYSFSIPTKARRVALKSALSAKIAEMKIIKDFLALEAPKTKEFVKLLNTLELSGKVLVIADPTMPENQHLELASRNVPYVKLISPINLNVKDILEADNILIAEAATKVITERLS